MIALMFPGQGSQAVGMGRDLYEAHEAARFTFDAAATVLGYDVARLCFEGPAEQLAQTEFTQPALLTHSVATLRVLQEHDLAFRRRPRAQPRRVLGPGGDRRARRSTTRCGSCVAAARP